MEKILLLVFFLLSLFSLCSSYLQKVSEETDTFRETITNNSQVIVLSDENIINGDAKRKKEILESMKFFSETYQLNIYKYDVNPKSSASIFFTKINFDSKKIANSLCMSIPEKEENFTVENKNILSSENKYIFKDFDQLIQSDVLSGKYIVQYKKKKRLTIFVKV